MATPPEFPSETATVLDEVVERVRPTAERGEVATYIPTLAGIDPGHFALSVSALDGSTHACGDADVLFSVQSITKIFALTLAVQVTEDHLWERVGREPSGDPFNSLVQLEHERGIPRNPMINSGAIVVADILLDKCDDARATLLELMSELSGAEVGIDEEVLRSESETGTRNRALANLMASFGNLHHPVEQVLGNYFHQSSIMMTARQLSRAIGFLANDGVDPASGKRVLSASGARRVTAVMLTCGTYDAAGEFAFSVGLPCKSGVGGGIVAVVPDQMGICVWSPPLDHAGNSLAGRKALEQLTTELELSIF
jgi:glutaminase